METAWSWWRSRKKQIVNTFFKYQQRGNFIGMLHAVSLFTVQVNLPHLPTSANIVLIVSYFLIVNQSSFIKIRSISISSPCRFYFVLYCFIGFSWSPLPLRSAQSRGPLDLLCPCFCPYQSS